MKRLCRHTPHRTIDDIFAPKYSTNEVLINVNKIREGVDDYLIHFSKAPSLPGWFHVSRKDVVKQRIQGNGAGKCYVISMDLLEPFEPIKECEHELY